MKIRSKVFLAIFISSSLLAGMISWSGFSLAKRQLVDAYSSRYELLSEVIGDTILQLEGTAQLLSISAIEYVKQFTEQHGIPTNGQLREFTQRLGVPRIYIVQKDGEFIRDSEEDIPDVSLFDFCEGYRELVEGEQNLATTPIIPSVPYAGAYKFTMAPSLDRSIIIEVGMKLQFIGEILRHAMASDENILSVGLFAASGKPLGYISKDGTEWQIRDNDPQQLLAENIVDATNSHAVFFKRIDLDDQGCCECRQKQVTDAEGNFYYILRTEVSLAPLKSSINASLSVTAIALFVALLLALALARYLSNLILRRLHLINRRINDIMASGDMDSRVDIEGKDEAADLTRNFNSMLATLSEHQKKLISATRDKSIAKIASQVAHDVRSPLAALDTIISHAGSIEERHRTTLLAATQSIRSMASNLLQHYSKGLGTQLEQNTGLSYNVQAIIESVVAEIQVQYQVHDQIDISFQPASQAHLLFSCVDRVDLRRVLSNIIVNAAESLRNLSGHIIIGLSPHPDGWGVEVNDSGVGMSAERVRKVLSLDKFTSDKRHGHGLGLAFVKEKILSWGGRIEIQSQEGKGTTVTMIAPRSPLPEWFLPAILIDHDTTIVAIDDDPSVHGVWKEKFFGLAEVINFNSLPDFLTYLQSHDSKGQALYLLDYDFKGASQSGLDFAAKHGIEDQTVLVTGRAESCALLEQAATCGIKIIPKPLAPTIPIFVRKSGHKTVDHVLFEDNAYICQAWEIAANAHGVSLEVVSNLDQLLAALVFTTDTTNFYLDYHLNDAFNGLDAARVLYQIGVRNIYLTTGKSAADFGKTPWLKAIMGKDPPFAK